MTAVVLAQGEAEIIPVKAAATVALVHRGLVDELKKIDGTIRDQAESLMDVGDKVTGKVGAVSVGYVQLVKGARTASVTNRTQFEAWMRGHRKDAFELVPLTVDESTGLAACQMIAEHRAGALADTMHELGVIEFDPVVVAQDEDLLTALLDLFGTTKLISTSEKALLDALKTRGVVMDDSGADWTCEGASPPALLPGAPVRPLIPGVKISTADPSFKVVADHAALAPIVADILERSGIGTKAVEK